MLNIWLRTWILDQVSLAATNVVLISKQPCECDKDKVWQYGHERRSHVRLRYSSLSSIKLKARDDE